QPEDDCAADAAGRPEPTRDPVDETDEDGVDLSGRAAPPSERGLRSDRAPTPSDLDASRVAIVRERVQLPPCGRPEQRDQACLGDQRDLAHGADPPSLE